MTTHRIKADMIRRLLLSVGAAFLLALAPCANRTARGQAVEVTAYTPLDSVSVGERFPLVVAVRHENELRPLFPDSVTYGDLAFGDVEAFSIISRGDRMVDVSFSDARVDSIVFEVATFAIDTAFVAPIPIDIISGSDTLTASSNLFFIPVRSIVSENAADIRDIAPLVDFPRSILPWLLGLLIATLVALLVVYLFKRFKPEPEPAPVPEAPEAAPYDVAMKRLRDLEKADVEGEEATKSFYDEVSDTLRSYLSATLHIHTLEETTREIVRDLRAKADPLVRQVESSVPDRVSRVLEFADLVKFADYVPSSKRNGEIIAETRDTVDTVERGVRATRREMASDASAPV